MARCLMQLEVNRTVEESDIIGVRCTRSESGFITNSIKSFILLCKINLIYSFFTFTGMEIDNSTTSAIDDMMSHTKSRALIGSCFSSLSYPFTCTIPQAWRFCSADL